MTKPRAMFVVLVTAAAGYLFASGDHVDLVVLAHLLIGAGLSGGGSIVLNQFLEREHDAKMNRTCQRPLPTGLVRPTEALVYGIVLSVVGCLWLLFLVNGITAGLAALCVLTYVLVYTPLKRTSTLNTAVGAVPGAIPPMMGWAAVTGTVGFEAWLLFAILFIWQFPHFLAISWLYRQDYARAGYVMLPVVDAEGHMTSRQMLWNTVCLFAVTLVPVGQGLVGSGYGVGATVLGLGLMALAAIFAVKRTSRMARWVLRGSVVHITLLMVLLVVDHA